MDIESFLTEYNDYASLNRLQIVTLRNISDKDIDTDMPNFYELLSLSFPTIEKYIHDNKCKIYCGSKQILVDKNYVCEVCSNNFKYISSVSKYNNKYVHTFCVPGKENNVSKIKEHFVQSSKENVCTICSNECRLLEPIFMDKQTFCHKKCYIEKLSEFCKDYKCDKCKKPIHNKITPLKFYEFDGKYLHEYCNTNFDIKAVTVKTNYKKCDVCGFYVYKGSTHNECIKMLKELK